MTDLTPAQRAEVARAEALADARAEIHRLQERLAEIRGEMWQADIARDLTFQRRSNRGAQQAAVEHVSALEGEQRRVEQALAFAQECAHGIADCSAHIIPTQRDGGAA